MVPLYSCRLVGILASKSPPPLGERTRQSRRTNSHFDSHTNLAMSHHDSDIPKRIYSPPLVWKVEPSRTYGNPVGLFHPMVVESHEDLSQFIDYINVECWY